MLLQEILEKEKITNIEIMYRVYVTIEDKIYDELFGYCKYENGELISLDGDSYYLSDKICKYEYPWEDCYGDRMLVVWMY